MRLREIEAIREALEHAGKVAAIYDGLRVDANDGEFALWSMDDLVAALHSLDGKLVGTENDLKAIAAELERVTADRSALSIALDTRVRMHTTVEGALAVAVAESERLREALVEAEEEILYVLDEFNRGDVMDAEEGARKARRIVREALAGGAAAPPPEPSE